MANPLVLTDEQFIDTFIRALRVMGAPDRPGHETDTPMLGLFVGQSLRPITGLHEKRGHLMNSIYHHGDNWVYWHNDDDDRPDPYDPAYHAFRRQWESNKELRKRAIEAALQAGVMRIAPVGAIQADNTTGGGLVS